MRMFSARGGMVFKDATDKYGAAQNAFIAKHTFSTLSEEQKLEVRKMTVELLASGGFSPEYAVKREETLFERERYLFYSVAMAHLGIAPGLKGILFQDEWYPVDGNLFATLLDADAQLTAAKFEVKQKYNIDINLD